MLRKVCVRTVNNRPRSAVARTWGSAGRCGECAFEVRHQRLAFRQAQVRFESQRVVSSHASQPSSSMALRQVRVARS